MTEGRDDLNSVEDSVSWQALREAGRVDPMPSEMVRDLRSLIQTEARLERARAQRHGRRPRRLMIRRAAWWVAASAAAVALVGTAFFTLLPGTQHQDQPSTLPSGQPSTEPLSARVALVALADNARTNAEQPSSAGQWHVHLLSSAADGTRSETEVWTARTGAGWVRVGNSPLAPDNARASYQVGRCALAWSDVVAMPTAVQKLKERLVACTSSEGADVFNGIVQLWLWAPLSRDQRSALFMVAADTESITVGGGAADSPASEVITSDDGRVRTTLTVDRATAMPEQVTYVTLRTLPAVPGASSPQRPSSYEDVPFGRGGDGSRPALAAGQTLEVATVVAADAARAPVAQG